MNLKHEDIHIPSLAALTTAGDWSALVRYWIAHQHEPALADAINTAQILCCRDSRWRELPLFLESVRTNPGNLEIAPSESLCALAEGPDALTLTILYLLPRAALCECGNLFPPEQQEELFLMATTAAEQAAKASLAAGDQALCAFFLSILARGLCGRRQLTHALAILTTSLEFDRRCALQQPELYLQRVAASLNNLGSISYELNNLEAAMGYLAESSVLYRQLVQRTPNMFEATLAAILNSLGNIQLNLEDPKSACSSYADAAVLYRALAHIHPKQFRMQLAATLNNLGITQRTLNEAIASRDSFEEGLRIRRELTGIPADDYNRGLATTLTFFGNAQRALNQLEEALGSLTEAVTYYRTLARNEPDVYFRDLAISLNNLGNVQCDLKHLDSAHESFTEALRICRQSAQQPSNDQLGDLAMILNGLGIVQQELRELNAARISYEEALALRRALVKQDPDLYRPHLARSLNNLGYVQQQLNDPEAAATHYEKAVTLYRELSRQQPDVYQPELAGALSNTGNVRRDMVDFAAARNHHAEALKVYRGLMRTRPDIYSADVAMALVNVGNDYSEMKELETALDYYEEALFLYRGLARQRPAVFLSNVASVLNNAGSVFYSLGKFETARDRFESALELLRSLDKERPNVHHAEMAGCHNNLGAAHRSLNDLDAALDNYNHATRLFDADPMSQFGANIPRRVSVWTNVGRLHRMARDSARPDFAAARQAFRKAVGCAETFRGRLHDRVLRNAKHSEMLEPYEELVRTCVDLWDEAKDVSALEEAVHVTEQCRSRSLTDRLSECNLAPRNAPIEKFDEFRQLRREIDAAKLALKIEQLGLESNRVQHLAEVGSPQRHLSNLLHLLRAAPSLGGLAVSAEQNKKVPPRTRIEAARVLAEAETHIATLESELRRADPEWDADQPAIALSCTEIQALIPVDLPIAFVQFSIFSDFGCALVIRRESIQYVKLPQLSATSCKEVAQLWNASYCSSRSDCSVDWECSMDKRLSIIGAGLLPLWTMLEKCGIRRAVLSPTRWLYVFPLHACFLADGRRRAGDVFEVSYTPSFSILGRCASRTREAIGHTLIVGNPTGDLPFSEVEIATTKGHLSRVIVLDSSKATKPAIFADAPNCWLFLYTGHAIFDTDNPLLSSLILETKDERQRANWLSLGDTFCWLNLCQCRLAILNGCESGLLKPDRTDEYLALSSGFLHAGAVCVLGTLWAVHDLSAALLMDRFFLEWRGGKNEAAALHEAARWLRDDIRSCDELLRCILPEFLERVRSNFLQNAEKFQALQAACVARANEYSKRADGGPPFASPAHWAAFVPIGKAW